MHLENYKAAKGKGFPVILLITMLYNILLVLLLQVSATYELTTSLKAAIVVFNLYQLYYIFTYISINYSVDNEFIYITSAFGLKTIKILITEIKGYKKDTGLIKGVKVSGYGRSYFAIGRSVIDRIGMAYMFVTSTKNIIYLKTEGLSYGISPENFNEFEEKINKFNIEEIDWEYKPKKNVHLYKDKRFMFPFIIVSIMAIVLTLNPVVLYLLNKIPPIMPLDLDANFVAVKLGSAKQFAFKQCIYGVLNMALLFCMYYAAYFYARYDKKYAYKFIYVPLISSLIFLLMQIKILINFI